MNHPLEKADYSLLEFWFKESNYIPSDPWAISIHKELTTPHYDSDGNPLPVLVVLAGGEQSGKHLSLDTPISTTSGWKTMAEIQVGDEVFDEQGNPTKVLWVSEPQKKFSYEMRFDNGDSVIASGEHKWFAQNYSARKHGFKARIFTTEEMSKNVRLPAPHNKRLFANYSIRNPRPVSYQRKDLPIDPYVLGAWLGDGTSSGSGITGIDEEIFQEISRRGYPIINTNIDKHKRIFCAGPKGKNIFPYMLKEIGVFKNKHIPTEYLQGSVDQRLDLLRGLMDTDGYVDTKGRISFTNTNPRIIAGVVELVSSLGFSHRLREDRAMLYGKDCGQVWDVSFQTKEKVFCLTRKLARQPLSNYSVRSDNIYITSIVPVGDRIVKCLGVEASSHLFLCGRTFIPTHNSFLGGHHIYGMHLWGKIFWIVGARYEDCRREFEYLTDAAIRAGVMSAENVSFPSGAQPCRAVFNNGARVRTLSSDDATTLASESPDGILMVEAGRQSFQAFRTLWTRAHHSLAWFLVSGTFESSKGRWFPDLWKQGKGENEYHAVSFSLPSYANPKMYPQGADTPKILALKKTLSEEEFAERILGMARPTLGVVFPEFRRTTHVKMDADYDKIFPVRLWVDPGWHPSSYAVLFVQIVNDQVRVFKEIYTQYLTNEQIIDVVINDPLISKVERVVIDIAAQTHAGAQDPAIETWRRGLVGRNIPIVTNFVKVEHGLQRTHDRLRMNPLTGAPYLVVHPRCENTISEFEEGYRWPIKKDNTIGQGGTVPIDANNHSAKAVAYGLIDAFGFSDGPRQVNAPSQRRQMKWQTMGRVAERWAKRYE